MLNFFLNVRLEYRLFYSFSFFFCDWLNNGLFDVKNLYFSRKIAYSLTFSLTSSILVIVFLIILNSKRPIFTTSFSFGKL